MASPAAMRRVKLEFELTIVEAKRIATLLNRALRAWRSCLDRAEPTMLPVQGQQSPDEVGGTRAWGQRWSGPPDLPLGSEVAWLHDRAFRESNGLPAEWEAGRWVAAVAYRPDEGLLTGLANDDDSKSEDDVSMHAQAPKRKRSTSSQGTTAVASAPRFPFPRTLLTMRCVCQRLPNDDLGHGCIAPRNLEATTEEARNYCSRCGPGPDDCICPCGACEPSSSD